MFKNSTTQQARIKSQVEGLRSYGISDYIESLAKQLELDCKTVATPQWFLWERVDFEASGDLEQIKTFKRVSMRKFEEINSE